MNVKELIELLKLAPQDALVIKSIDGEGNGYDTVESVEVSQCLKEDWEIHPLHPDDIAEGEYNQEQLDSSFKGVVIW